MFSVSARDRRWIALAVVLFAASLAVVNATVFAYRYLTGSVSAVASTGLTNETAAELGAACTGFYINNATTGDTIANDTVLPTAGTNNEDYVNTNTTSWLGVKVDFSNAVPSCQWEDGVGINTLYESATVYLNVSAGTWYVKDFLGFGYPLLDPAVQPDPVYVTVKPTQALSNANITSAEVLIYANGTLIGTVDLTNTSSSVSFQLSPGDGVQLDLRVRAIGEVSDAGFELGFYVSTTSEAPR